MECLTHSRNHFSIVWGVKYNVRNTKGTLILVLAALIWGVAFVAQTSAGDSVGAFTFNAARSFVGVIFLVAVIAVRGGKGKQNRKNTGTSRSEKRNIIGGLACGGALFCAANFQQFGINIYPDGVAVAGRAGFLTATYVVMVALCDRLFGKKLHPLVLVSAAGCVAGMYMLCLSGGLSGIYLGDAMILCCAVCFTGHIMIIDRFADADGIKMSCVQFAVCGVLSLACALIFERPHIGELLDAWIPILYTGVMSSGVAYTLQIVGQKYAEPAVASIAMSLESVFSAIAGWVILNERLSARELTGCALVFAAVILAQVPSFLKKKKA